jgi:uncharacterized protein (TIGR00251 family)
LRIHAQPRAARSDLAGIHNGRLKIRLAAPPVDGAANEELVRFLARLLEVPRSRISLVAGGASKHKLVQVEGITLASTLRKLRL